MSKIIAAKISSGISTALLGALPLKMLGMVRYQYRWEMLGDWYMRANNVSGIELPLGVRVFWPFAAVAWWSYISPIALGVFFAFRSKQETSYLISIFLTFGSLFIFYVSVSSICVYLPVMGLMGKPVFEPIELSCAVGNLSLIGCSILIAGKEILPHYKKIRR